MWITGGCGLQEVSGLEGGSEEDGDSTLSSPLASVYSCYGDVCKGQ